MEMGQDTARRREGGALEREESQDLMVLRRPLPDIVPVHNSLHHVHPVHVALAPRLSNHLSLVASRRACPRLLLMSTDVSTLRAELKSFEHNFRKKHERDPSVDDIKKAGLGLRSRFIF